ncbi:MAG: response regulator [Verrucomicrobia bacterium]|nr:response regulator [Verrucomicrobiota bacterium]
MTVRALIVDDEAPARERVRDLLAGEPDIAIVAECANGREAIAAVGTHRPDLLFLDIQMPQVNGFDVLRALPASQLPAVIFTTAYDRHALRAFEVHALDYLLKPFKQARFKAALQRAREHLRQRGLNGAGETDARILALLQELRPKRTYATRFVIKTASRVVIVKAGDIDWIESAANYALLHVGDKTHVHRETMRALEEQLSPAQFLRISRSAIVNLERIKELQPMVKGEYVVILHHGKQLTMTRGLRELQQALGPD